MAKVAERDTEIFTGGTLGEYMDVVQVGVTEQLEEISNLGKTVTELNKTLDLRQNRIEELEAEVKLRTEEAVAAKAKIEKLALVKAAGPAGAFQRLPNGSARVMVTLDSDTITPMLEWAQGAGREPGEYIQEQIQDAIIAVTLS